MQYHLHIHILINTRSMYYPYRIRSVHIIIFTLFFRTSKHLLCTCANIPIITPHMHAHSNTNALYGQIYFISKCFLKLNSVNLRRIFINLKHQVYGTSVHLNHCTWHIKVHKSLHMAHKCTQITAHGTSKYINHCTRHINEPKLLHMAHKCTQITPNGT
jgi:hypothetical protein